MAYQRLSSDINLDEETELRRLEGGDDDSMLPAQSQPAPAPAQPAPAPAQPAPTALAQTEASWWADVTRVEAWGFDDDGEPIVVQVPQTSRKVHGGHFRITFAVVPFAPSGHDDKDGPAGSSGDDLPVASPHVDADHLLRAPPPPGSAPHPVPPLRHWR